MTALPPDPDAGELPLPLTVRKLLATPLLRYNINQQAELIKELIAARMMASPSAELLLQTIALALDLPPARIDAICRLDEPQDWRRALKVRELLPPARLPSEAVYPRDGWLGRYLAWAEHMEVPLAWHFWAGLSLIAACSRRNYYYDTGAFRIWPSLYVCLVGPSGGGKSLCLQSCAEPMLKRTNQWLEANPLGDDVDDTINLIPERLSTAAFLERCMHSLRPVLAESDEEHTDIDGEVRKRGVKLKYMRRKDSTSFILKDELMAFIGRQMFDADTWCGLMLDLSNGKESFVNPTVTAGNRVLNNVAVTALFASAPDNLRKAMPPTFYTGGLQGRFIWCWRAESGRRYPVIPPLDPVERDALASWLGALSRLPEIEVIRHPSTDSWWEQYYLAWDEAREIEPNFISWHNRVKDQMLRVAMLLAVSNGRFVIQLEDLELAKEALEIERRQFTALFAQIAETKDGETTYQVLSALVAARNTSTHGWVSEGFLCQKLLHTVGSVAQVQRALALLAKAGEIELGTKKTTTHGPLQHYWRHRLTVSVN